MYKNETCYSTIKEVYECANVTLGCYNSPEYESFLFSLTDFIAKALGYERQAERAKDIIDKLSEVQVLADFQSINNSQSYNIGSDELFKFIVLKGRMLERYSVKNKQYFERQNMLECLRSVGFERKMETCKLLGIIEYLGLCGIADSQKAEKWWLRAAYYGDMFAMRALGLLYDDRGDFEQGKLWKKTAELVLGNDTFLKRILSDDLSSQTANLVIAIKNLAFLKDNRFIDYSLVELVLSQGLSYEQKLAYCNNVELNATDELARLSGISLHQIGFGIE